MEEYTIGKTVKGLISRPKKLFWALCLTGWGVMGLINIVFQTDYFSNNPAAIAYSGLITFTGVVGSFLIRYLILKLDVINKKWSTLIPVVVTILLVVSVLSVFFFSFCIILFIPDQSWSWSDFFGNCFNFALVLCVWTLIYLSSLFFERQQRLMEQKFDLLLQLKSAELNNLRKQLSPHFLFNSINNIRSLIMINPEEARRALLNISDLLRFALNYQKKETVPVAEEMEVVTAYIELNKIHLNNKVTFEIFVEDELNGMMIPPMSIQLLVENAIKHGDLMEGACVKVSIMENQGVKVIEVVNSGQLRVSEANSGIGLANLRQRLASTFHNNAELTIEQCDNFVKAEIKIVV